MKPFAILFTKKKKGEKPTTSMVILVTPEKITAYGLPGIGKIIVDGMNEDFATLDKAGVTRTANNLKERYTDGGTGYGSSIVFLDHATHKSTIDKAIRSLTSARADVVLGKDG